MPGEKKTGKGKKTRKRVLLFISFPVSLGYVTEGGVAAALFGSAAPARLCQQLGGKFSFHAPSQQSYVNKIQQHESGPNLLASCTFS